MDYRCPACHGNSRQNSPNSHLGRQCVNCKLMWTISITAGSHAEAGN